MNSQSNRHTHYQAAPANAQTKAWQRVCLSHPDKIELKKPSLPSENKKYATAQTDTTRTVKRTIDNGLQGRTTEHQPVTSVWRNGADVLRMKLCVKFELCASYGVCKLNCVSNSLQ